VYNRTTTNVETLQQCHCSRKKERIKTIARITKMENVLVRLPRKGSDLVGKQKALFSLWEQCLACERCFPCERSQQTSSILLL